MYLRSMAMVRVEPMILVYCIQIYSYIQPSASEYHSITLDGDIIII